MAIPLTSESARPPATLIDGEQMSLVELRGRDPKLVAPTREAEDFEIAAGAGRKGKRAEYRCAFCGYGIVVHEQPPGCPMCGEARWEHVEWRPFSQSLDGLTLPFRRRLGAASSPTAEEPIRYLRPGQARSSARKMRPREELEQLSPRP